jgi:ABC-type Mn2+/Zn2+ transport system permease subunit
VIVVAALAVLHPSLLVAGFDRLNAAALGRRPAVYDVVLAVLLAAATLVAVRVLGNLLVVAMLIGPAAAARALTRRMVPMMLLATCIAAAAAVGGMYVSYHAELAAGASVALALVAAFLVATVTGRSAARTPG